MSGKIPGRAAYDAWWATAEGVPRHPDVTYDQDGAAWEAAAAAGAASAHQRVAELVTEVNELRALLDVLRGALADAAGHVEPVDQNSELAIARWRELARPEAGHA